MFPLSTPAPPPSPAFGSPDFSQFMVASKPKLGCFAGRFCRPGKEGLAQGQGEATSITIALQLQQNCLLTTIWLSITPFFQYFSSQWLSPNLTVFLLTKSGYSEDGGPEGFKHKNVVTTLAAEMVLQALPCRGLVKIFIVCQSLQDRGPATSRPADGGQGTCIYV